MTTVTIAEAEDLYAGAESAHDFDHVLRVLALAERIAGCEGADVAVVRCAVLLHDIARNAERETGEDHAIAAARQARILLSQRGASAEFCDAVATAIANHRFRGGGVRATLEAQILYDADKLDAIGAIGIARAYAVGGRVGQRLWSDVAADERIDPANPTAHVPDHTPVREYVVKLARVKKTLFTREARRIAQGRHRFMRAYFARLAREVSGDL